MKYITFVSREVWPAFNSLYAYTKLKGKFPENILIFYTDTDMGKKLRDKINVLYRENGKRADVQMVKINDSIEEMSKLMKELVSKGDIVDITGARKSMLLALMDIKKVLIVYLFLKDMRFSSYPFMMRPISLQIFSEVQR